jgi:DNA-binding response OmpR family regulator
MARVLSVSYDWSLLETRELLLKSNGHAVTSARRVAEVLEHCQNGTRFDLLILGHSIPDGDKETLIKTFRAACPAPVIALNRHGEATVRAAGLAVEPDPRVLLDAVATLIPARKGTAA